jgi:hypothetical protein
VRKRSLIVPTFAALALATGLGRAGAAPRNTYVVHNLVSDQAGKADRVDPNLVNAWGLASRVDSPWWVADNGTGKATVYTRSTRTFTHDGALRTGNGKRLVIDGLWALQLGHGAANNGPANTLFFTAGPDDEAHGLFGTITTG